MSLIMNAEGSNSDCWGPSIYCWGAQYWLLKSSILTAEELNTNCRVPNTDCWGWGGVEFWLLRIPYWLLGGLVLIFGDYRWSSCSRSLVDCRFHHSPAKRLSNDCQPSCLMPLHGQAVLMSCVHLKGSLPACWYPLHDYSWLRQHS